MEKQHFTEATVAPGQHPAWEIPDKLKPRASATVLLSRISKKLCFPPTISSDSPTRRFKIALRSTRTYTPLKLRLQTLLLLLLGVSLTFIGLILGLAIGLTLRNKHASVSQGQPLPTSTAIYHGDLTYYDPGLGACGITSADSDYVVAVSHILWDSQATGSNPNANPLCGRLIRAERFDSRVERNVSLDVKIVDRCVSCQATDLDMSPGAFGKLADPNLGRVHDLNWAWV